MHKRFFFCFSFLCLFLFTQAQPLKESIPIFVSAGELPGLLAYKGTSSPVISAHRGGIAYPGYPENSLETFQYVWEQVPAIMECDIQMTLDSVLILLHDPSLERNTTGTGRVDQMTWDMLQDVRLKDPFGMETPFHIPRLTSALRWAKGKTLLQLDVKRGVPFSKVVDAIADTQTEDAVVVIVYSIQDALEVHRLNPRLMLSVSMRNEEELQRALDSGIPTRQMIAFTGTRLSPPALYQAIHEAGMLCILGVLGNLDRQAEARGDGMYQQWLDLGVDVLATNRPVEAARQVLTPAALQQGIYARP